MKSTDAIEKIEIFNPIGQRIFSRKFNQINKQVSLSLSGFSSGVYFLKLHTAKGEVSCKILKLDN